MRIDTLTLSDQAGPYAQIGGIKVDWSPAALVGGVFKADHVSADTVNFIRAPLPPKTPVRNPDNDQFKLVGFAFAVGVRVAQIDLPDINLSQALSGRDFSLSVKGSIDATGPDIALDLQMSRKDEPDAKALADIVYAPSENRLTLKASVSEPQGGLLARLLRLPGTPAVELALDGQGPLSDWAGKLQGSVGNVPVISVDGKHILVANGGHRLELTGGGQLSTLLPPAFGPCSGEPPTSISLRSMPSPAGSISKKANSHPAPCASAQRVHGIQPATTA